MPLPNVPVISTQISSPLCLFLITGQDKVTAETVRKSVWWHRVSVFWSSPQRIKIRERGWKLQMYYFYFLSLQLNPTTIHSWVRSCLCKAPASQTVCKNALLLANESKDSSGFQGSVSCSYFSLRQLTKGKKVPIKKKGKARGEAERCWGI